MNSTAALARSITWASSKQSFLTAMLLADRDFVDDSLRAYAYFRWVDDRIDDTLDAGDERVDFIRRQKALVEKLYRKERPDHLSPEEQMLADLIEQDRGTDGGLQSFINNFMSILEFDANRKGRLISQNELAAYSVCLGSAVMDGIQHFIGNCHPYPKTPERLLAVIAAHITHMLRDMLDDISVGYFNIPSEYLTAHAIRPKDVDSEPFRAWVREQVELARSYFREGKRYIDELDVLRCKLAGTWYCTRFECVLDAIERDSYKLRAEYNERRNLAIWIEIAWSAFKITLKHFAQRARKAFSRTKPRSVLGSDVNPRSHHLK